MPFSRLRVNRPSDAALRRHSTLDPANIHGDARSSQEVVNDSLHPARSSSPLRNSIDPAGAANDASFGEKTLRPPSPNLRQQRFSILKFRHASDSQLAKTAKEQAAASTPPMPSSKFDVLVSSYLCFCDSTERAANIDPSFLPDCTPERGHAFTLSELKIEDQSSNWHNVRVYTWGSRTARGPNI